MLRYLVTHRLKALLERVKHSPLLPALVGILAAVSSLSMSLPWETIVIPTILLVPQRWIGIWLSSTLGGSAGGAVLAYLFHAIGWSTLHAHFPQIATSHEWQNIAHWVEQYGFWALAAVAMLPLPETPAIIVASLSHQPVASLFLALLIGKFVKYGLIAWLVAAFPRRFHEHLYGQDLPQAAIAQLKISGDAGPQPG